MIVKLFENRDEVIKNGIDHMKLLEDVANNTTDRSDIKCEFYESASDVPKPQDLDKSHKNLMVFDDLQLEKQNTCELYYVRGRHSNVDCIYLAQNYFKLPRQTIRENANFICIFPQDQKNVNHIYSDHASTDKSKDEFKALCKTAWSTPHGFLTIDLTSKKFYGKYRCGLDIFIYQRDFQMRMLAHWSSQVR